MDYLTEDGNSWWQNDGDYNDQHVCGVTILCDRDATDGAHLFSFRFFTEREMSMALLIDTAKLIAPDSEFAFPGWRSVGHAVEFLHAEI